MMEIVPVPQQQQLALFTAGRTSTLATPTQCLEGHRGEVFSVKFNRSGSLLASASLDHDIFLWDVFAEPCATNVLVLKGHTLAVLDVVWTLGGSGGLLLSGSADHTLALWDAAGDGTRIHRFQGHRGTVCAVAASQTHASLVASASNDHTARLWDLRENCCATLLPHGSAQSTAVAFGNDMVLFTGALDGKIRQWDLRAASSDDPSSNKPVLELLGHEDVITGIALSPVGEGAFLLSNSADGHLRVWDVRPYVRPGQNRCVKVMDGHVHDPFERSLLHCGWASDGKLVSAGSADGVVNIWSTTSRLVVHKLAGHSGSVNDVQFHPAQPIIASCSSDKTIIIGELPAQY